MSNAPSHYIFWLAGRSAGLVALALVTGSVILGLAMAARVLPTRMRRGAMRTHQHLALIGLAAIAAHGLLLAADPWLKAGVKGVLVPLAIGYRPAWIALGILGGYLAAILGLSFYLRRRIGARLWRSMHRLTVLAYVLSLAHALGSGTDASVPLVRGAMLASALPVLVLFALRLARSGESARARERASSVRAGTAARALPAPPGQAAPAVPAPARAAPARTTAAPGRLGVSPSQAR